LSTRRNPRRRRRGIQREKSSKRRSSSCQSAVDSSVRKNHGTHFGFSSLPVKPESCCLAANIPRPLVREFHIVMYINSFPTAGWVIKERRVCCCYS